jgi:hypothetical protein
LSTICSATKRDGSRCNLPVSGQQTGSFCWAHSPENAAQRRRIAALGGRGRANGPVKELQRRLDDIIERVLADQLVAYKGSVAAQLIGQKIRLLELEKKLAAEQESEERLRRIEALERGRGRGWLA